MFHLTYLEIESMNHIVNPVFLFDICILTNVLWALYCGNIFKSKEKLL